MVTEGPTTGAGEFGGRAWGARPWTARVIKVVTVLLPIGCAVGLTILAGPSLYRGPGWTGTVGWVLQTMVLSTATVLVVDRFARRVVPLGGLFNLSLVFPDEAPSRFAVALKAGTTKRLSAELLERPADETVNEAAARLLALVSDLNHHDRLTRGHTERVRAYADLIAEQLGLDAEKRWKLRWAVLLHDIGKLTVPPEILNKDSKPTDEEWAILSGHPAAGAAMVEPLADWLGEWRLAAGEHHERWDGTGYPNGLAGEEISLAGRIVAVADAYDVITSVRSYKQPTEASVARQELVRCAGTQFDPEVVRAFLNVSLGKLRLVGGPLAWLASMGTGGGNIPAAIASAATNAAVTASIVVSTVIGSGASLPSTPVTGSTPAAASVQVGAGDSGSNSERSSSGSASSNTHPSARGDLTSAADADGPGAEGVGDASTTTTTVGGVSPIDGTATSPGATPTPAPSGPAAAGVTTTTVRSAGSATTTTVVRPTTTVPGATTAPPATTTTVAVPPNIKPDAVSVATATQIDIDVLANDVKGTASLVPSTMQIVTPPAHGTASDHSHKIRYQSTSAFVGTDTVTYQVCDNGGHCGTATVTITVTG